LQVRATTCTSIRSSELRRWCADDSAEHMVPVIDRSPLSSQTSRHAVNGQLALDGARRSKMRPEPVLGAGSLLGIRSEDFASKERGCVNLLVPSLVILRREMSGNCPLFP
jgi:hypothetical protein